VNNRIVPKIDLLFDQLQIALENERYETADLALAKHQSITFTLTRILPSTMSMLKM